jgi:hypothetical protein
MVGLGLVECWVLVGLATKVRHVSSVWFGYRSETYELYLVLAIGVRQVSWWPWVTVGSPRCNVMLNSYLGIGAIFSTTEPLVEPFLL